jgi:hypothetical protein
MPQLISYAHSEHPDGQRFLQYESDPLPSWAVNVKQESSTLVVQESDDDDEVITIN